MIGNSWAIDGKRYLILKRSLKVHKIIITDYIDNPSIEKIF